MFNKGGRLMRERRRRYKIGITLLFEWFVVDKTHCILIFNHSFDELSFSKSLCEGGKRKHRRCYHGKEMVNKIYSTECGVKMRFNNHSYLRNPFLSSVGVLMCVCVCACDSSMQRSHLRFGP